MRASEIEIDNSSFDAETSQGLILAFFWDPWESGCRREQLIIKRAADIIGEQLRIGTCSVEKSPDLARRFNVRTIPTTLILKDGKEVERLVGLRHERTLIRHLNKYLEQKA